MTKKIKRGSIVTVVLAGSRGSEQGGRRPAIVISNNICNTFSPVITVIPITAKTDKPDLPTHLNIDHKKYKLSKPSIALTEQIVTIDKSRVYRLKGYTLDEQDMENVENAVRIQLGLTE